MSPAQRNTDTEPVAETAVAAIARARQVVAAVANPGLRAAVFDGASADSGRPGPRFGWIHPDGTIDDELLSRTADVLRQLMVPEVVLAFGRLETLPAAEPARRRIVERVVEIVVARLAPARRVSEPVLNAAIAMVATDVATIRRDAVDIGLLRRTPDGSVYEFAG
ncbi:DUF2087 domain-containing protein [Curtobacterium sp. Leaf261]|uniref:DUF2087 domain-containing protein n=1 Tax=Curtobacterium sp. Leaf261 TaxID=1736311 RepID=UPI0006F42A52|nr:DUF2087 domain-containing protein [Curtobacterium sp. Leaf261]KQO59797.1 hypothetical protein ASF23_16075 [Curtobacterium sp. Leaf261]